MTKTVQAKAAELWLLRCTKRFNEMKFKSSISDTRLTGEQVFSNDRIIRKTFEEYQEALAFYKLTQETDNE